MGSNLIDQAKEKNDKFEKARQILYGDSYANSHFLQKGWINTYTYYRLKSAELGDFFSSLGKDIKRGAKFTGNWIKDSKFGAAVKKSANAVATGGKIVGKATVFGAKAAASLLSFTGKKVYNAGKAFVKSAPVQYAARKTAGFFKTSGAWIKDRAIGLASKFKRNKAPKEPEMIELKSMEEIEQEKLNPKPKAEKKKLWISEAAGTLWRGMKKGGQFIAASAKKLAETKAAKAVSGAAVKAGKGLMSAAKAIGGKLKQGGIMAAHGIKSLAERASNAYDNVKSRYIDWSYKSGREKAITQNEIHEMLRNKAGGKEYMDRLKAFREELLNNKSIKEMIVRRAESLERISRNVDAMEQGKPGDIEMAELDSEDKAIEGTNIHGMNATINMSHSTENKVPDEPHEPAPDHKKDVKKTNYGELAQGVKDIKLLEENGLDPKNLPKQVPEDNKIIGTGPKTVKDKILTKIKQEAASIEDQTKTALEKTEKLGKMEKKIDNKIKDIKDINDKVDTVSSFLGMDGVNNVAGKIGDLKGKYDEKKKFVDTQLTTTNNILKTGNSISKLAKGEVNSKNVLKAAANTGVLTEDILNRTNLKIPISNVSKSLNNIVDLMDGKDKGKTITNLVDNVLTEAGMITKMVMGDNTFSNLSGLLHDDKIKASERVEGIQKAFKEGDKLDKAKEIIKDIQAGTELLKKSLDEFKVSHHILDQVNLIKPALDIIDGLKQIQKLAKVNEKLNALTPEDKKLGLSDKYSIHDLDLNVKDLVRQNKDKQKGAMANAIQNAVLSTAGILTGGASAVDAAEFVLGKVTPTQLLMRQLKKKTDHELMVNDIFGTKENYEQHKKKYHLTDKEVQNEIMKLTKYSSIKEYASRLRAEIALRLHSMTKQGEAHGKENAATKIREAGGIEGKSAKKIYKEIGGSMDYDKIVGRSKMDVHNKKLEEQKAEKARKKEEKTDKMIKDQNEYVKKHGGKKM